MRSLIIAGCVVLIAGSASADEPKLRELIECAPGKSFAKMANALGALKDSQLDTISTKPSMTLSVRDDDPMPKRVFHRASKGTETDLIMSEKGEITDFIMYFENDKNSEFCVEDPARQGQPQTGDSYSVNMRFNMNFHNTSGTYAMTELKDGLKDGKTALKKIIGGAKAVLVPGMSHIFVEFDDPKSLAQFLACKSEGQCEAVGTEKLGDAYLIAFDDLEDMDAKELRIKGGAHTVSPSLSPKKMAQIMGPGDDDNVEDNDEAEK